MTVHRREVRESELMRGGLSKVVAVINYFDDEVFDWAAYSGVGDVQYVAERGDKLLQGSAGLHFLDLPMEKYRA